MTAAVDQILKVEVCKHCGDPDDGCSVTGVVEQIVTVRSVNTAMIHCNDPDEGYSATWVVDQIVMGGLCKH